MTTSPPNSNDVDVLHVYDGIAEMDNNPPRWLMAALMVAVLWSVWYVAHYHLGTAKLGPDKWRDDMAALAELRSRTDTNLPDEATFRQLSRVPERIAQGKILFARTECANCHNDDGTGKEQGPNLVDRWWLHGSDMTNIAVVIRDGANNNSMPAHKTRLSNSDITNLTIFLVDLNRQGEKAGRAPDTSRAKEQPITY
jgi:cytochrome c oxidase cbb3-type subunit III